jgi:hypothetical protein
MMPVATQPVNPQVGAPPPMVGMANPMMAAPPPQPTGPVAPAGFMGAQPGQRLYAGKTAEESALYDFEQAQRKQAAADRYNAMQAGLKQNLSNYYSGLEPARQAAATAEAERVAAVGDSRVAHDARVAADRAVADQFKAVQMDMGDTTANQLGPRPQARGPQAPPKMSRQQFQQLQQRNPQAAQQYQQQVQNFQRASAPRASGPQQPQGGGGFDLGGMATGLGMNLGGKALESFGVPSGITKGLTGFLGKLF